MSDVGHLLIKQSYDEKLKQITTVFEFYNPKVNKTSIFKSIDIEGEEELTVSFDGGLDVHEFIKIVEMLLPSLVKEFKDFKEIIERENNA